MPKQDVMFGYLHPNEVSASFHKSLIALVGHDLSHNHRLHSWSSVKCATGGLPEGRNQLMQALLDSSAEWVLMVDADMGFEPVVLDQLLSVADPITRPIVGGLCFAQREAFEDGSHGFRCVPRPTIFDYIQHDDGHWRFTGRSHYPVNSLVQCAATGAALLLIHRKVAEVVLENYGPTWFTRVTGTDGAVMGEDISFFVRTQALDIPLFVHTGIRTTHLKQLWLGEPDFWTSFLSPPATEPVDVLIPSIPGRLENVAPLMQSLVASTGLAKATWILNGADLDKAALVQSLGGEVLWRDGSFAEKVNFGFGATERPWVLLVGDDVRFRAGWLDAAQDIARRYEVDVVGTNDLANPRVMRGEHATHPMIRRSYVETAGASWDGPGVVCHEGYRHWFVDDEIITVAKRRGTFQMALAAEVEHFHPIAGKAAMDETYKVGERHAKTDEALFRKRLKANS